MARIRYDRYLKDIDELVVISNTDGERDVDVTAESFKNPAIKFRILDGTGLDDPLTAFDISNGSTSEAIYSQLRDNASELVAGQLPDWKLTGVCLSPTLLSMHYVRLNPEGEETCGNIRYDTAIAHCISYADNWSITMELEVDYADGLPPRRYIIKMNLAYPSPDCDRLHVIIDVYFGKRKVRRLEFTERDGTELEQLCHITEY